MILSISLKRLCSGFGRTDIGYVNYEIIEHVITVTFPYNAKFLLPQERTILLFYFRFFKLLNSDTAIGGIKLNYNRSELAPLGKSKMEEMCTHSFSPGIRIS
jgi:hypothetical protein